MVFSKSGADKGLKFMTEKKKYNRGKGIFIKWPFTKKNASICLHNSPKDAELQHLRGIFSTYFSWFYFLR